jgi:hypothetical protein
MCSHTKIPHWVFIKGFPLRSRGQKWIQDLSKPYKYPFKIKGGNKGKKKKTKRKDKKRKRNINKKHKCRESRDPKA